MEKPSFRSAFKQRRCLIPASGFFEWQKQGTGRKQPFFIRPRDGKLFSFAGLWERWNDPDGKPIETCSVLTTTANDVMQPIHERMPIILDSEGDALWLDSRASSDALRALFVPYPGARMEAYPIDLCVNNPKNQRPRCMETVSA